MAEVFFHLLRGAEPAGRIGQGAHRDEGHIAERRLLEAERERGLRRRRSVHAGHHWPGSLVDRAPLSPDHHDPSPRVGGDLPGHRSEQRAGQPALTVRADHDHLGGAAPLAQHRGGRPPTSQNQAAIEADLRAFAEARLGLDDAELTRQCEQAIRKYDPCISCSAHFLDLTVERSLLIPNGAWYPCQVQDPGRSW